MNCLPSFIYPQSFPRVVFKHHSHSGQSRDPAPPPEQERLVQSARRNTSICQSLSRQGSSALGFLWICRRRWHFDHRAYRLHRCWACRGVFEFIGLLAECRTSSHCHSWFALLCLFFFATTPCDSLSTRPAGEQALSLPSPAGGARLLLQQITDEFIKQLPLLQKDGLALVFFVRRRR